MTHPMTRPITYPMTPVIAVRRLPWRRGDGTEATMEVRFGQPMPLPGSKDPDADWYCPYQIERIDVPFQIKPLTEPLPVESPEDRELLVEQAVYGVDSVQALCLALGMAGNLLPHLGGTPDPCLSEIPNLGFPIPAENALESP